jgi:hypothetical protein
MKFLQKFLHSVQVLTICCNYVAVTVASADDDSWQWRQQQQQQECAARRIKSNNDENSLNEWENLHSFDLAIQLNMTRRNLQSINETLLKSIDKASTASIFDLSINRISSIENGTFERFHNVRILIMRVNNLREITSQSFRGLMMLEELYLSENAIFDVERDSFRSMEYLHTIDLSENCLFTISPFLFYRTLRLLYVHLDRNFLNHIPALLMPSFQLLEKLSVAGNRFTNITSLIYYTNIQTLDLSDNPLSSQEISQNITDTFSSSSSSNSYSNENDDDNDYDDGDNYGRIESRRPFTATTPHQHHRRRYLNGNRVNSPLPDPILVRNERAAPMNIDLDYNSNIDYLMDTFRPGRISEEALESLIKMLLLSVEKEEEEKKKKEALGAVDGIHIINVMATFYENQNRTQFLHELKTINENFGVASLVSHVRKVVHKRAVRGTIWELSRHELQEVYEFRRTQQMKHFTCRKCSLLSIAFLTKFIKLKYIDVSGNMIKSLNMKHLASLKCMEQLIASNNTIESLNFSSMLHHWPDLHTLTLNDNPGMTCDLVRKMQNTATYLDKMFKLEVNKCK